MRVETLMKDAFLIEGELDHLLKKKATMKLKFELTDLFLKIKTKTDPAKSILNKFFEENKIIPDRNGNVLIQKYTNGGTQEETDVWKQFSDLNEQKIDFEHGGVTMDLLEQVETDGNYSNLIKLLLNNNLIIK